MLFLNDELDVRYVRLRPTFAVRLEKIVSNHRAISEANNKLRNTALLLERDGYLSISLLRKVNKMKAVITVIGKDTVGIISAISAECAEHGVNIIDISQSVLKDYFAMIMLVELEGLKGTFLEFQNTLDSVGKAKNLDIRVMHEDIFNSMHRI